MSFRVHVFYRSIALFSVFVAGWCLMWFAAEFVTWHKAPLQAVTSSWWNLVLFLVLVPVCAFATYVDDLIGFEENKQA